MRVPAEEDLHAAHAILDLSASTTVFLNQPQVQPVPEPSAEIMQKEVVQQLGETFSGSKTVAYTYEAFFVSDGRSKKKEVQKPQTVNWTVLYSKFAWHGFLKCFILFFLPSIITIIIHLGYLSTRLENFALRML